MSHRTDAGNINFKFSGQYITLKSQEDTIVRVTEVEAIGIEIDCPYSAFTVTTVTSKLK